MGNIITPPGLLIPDYFHGNMPYYMEANTSIYGMLPWKHSGINNPGGLIIPPFLTVIGTTLATQSMSAWPIIHESGRGMCTLVPYWELTIAMWLKECGSIMGRASLRNFFSAWECISVAKKSFVAVTDLSCDIMVRKWIKSLQPTFPTVWWPSGEV